MSEFNPSPNELIVIDGYTYQVRPHPSVPAFAFGQEGRKAFVYQIAGGPDESLYALKKFKLAFRVAELVEVCDSLARFSSWPGLEVCNRQCLQYGIHDDALSVYPDLEYAVLMPWISGRTWYDIVIGMTKLTKLEALTFAKAVTQVLSALEESGLAHCDIAAANVIVNPTTGRAHLIDIEDMYAPNFAPPAALPAGTDGYAHKTAYTGLWGPDADRFAGAVLVAEMAAWHVPAIRKEAEEEHYFSGDEMQIDSPRYRLIRDVLEQMDPRLPELLDRAWYSDTLDECPSMREWQEAVEDVHNQERLSKMVKGWQPLTVPQAMQDAEPRPFAAPSPSAVEEEPVEEAPVISVPEANVLPPQPTNGPPLQPVQQSIGAERTQHAQPSIPIKPAIEGGTGGPVEKWVPLHVPAPESGNGFSSAGPSQPSQPLFDAIKAPTIPQPQPDEAALPEAPQPDEVPEDDSADAQSSAPGSDDDSEVPQPAYRFTAYQEEYDVDEPPDTDPAADPGDYFEEEFYEQENRLPPPVLHLSHIDGRRPFLVWSQSPGATHYLLQEADNPLFEGAKEYTFDSDGETHWQKPRKPGLLLRRSDILHYRIRACIGDEVGEWSQVLAVQLDA